MFSPLPAHVDQHREQLHLENNDLVKKGFVKSFLQRHLPRSRLLQGEEEELKNRYQMLDNPKVKKNWKTGKDLRRKRKTLSARECRKLFKVEKEGQTYESYLPLHRLWLKYMQELTNFNNLKSIKIISAVQQRLLKADLHGCLLTVQRSKCPSYVGVTGILLQETKNTVNLITTENKVKCIPKQNSVFTFMLGTYQFTIYGNNFRVRSSERAVRKFKAKPTVDL